MKVYCGKCEHFSVISLAPDFYSESCSSTNNSFSNYRQEHNIGHTPEELNKDNDCKWFEEKKEKEKRKRRWHK